MGRPRIQIDVKQVTDLAKQGATHREIADYLGVSRSTISSKFGKDIAKIRALLHIRLRQTQWKTAIDGSVQMLMFLGKHELGQGVEEKGDVNVTIKRRSVSREGQKLDGITEGSSIPGILPAPSEQAPP